MHLHWSVQQLPINIATLLSDLKFAFESVRNVEYFLIWDFREILSFFLQIKMLHLKEKIPLCETQWNLHFQGIYSSKLILVFSFHFKCTRRDKNWNQQLNRKTVLKCRDSHSRAKMASILKNPYNSIKTPMEFIQLSLQSFICLPTACDEKLIVRFYPRCVPF